MSTTEQNGLMTYVDESGNKTLLYPITKSECVDGLEEDLAGKAPAGFGLGGGKFTTLTASDNLNSIWRAGWYYWAGSAPINAPTAPGTTIPYAYCVMRVDGVDHYGTRQTVFKIDDERTLCERHLYAGTPSSAWKWPHPVMQSSVEYLTTEFYLGKPVYARVIDIGYLPNTSNKYIEHGIGNIKQIVDARLLCTTADIAADYSSHRAVTGFAVDKWSYSVETSDDRSAYTANIVMKYTKTTD